MTKLVWDAVGQKQFEYGVDRGVLYLYDGTGVAWNGLTGVTEDGNDNTPDPSYADGVKYLNAASAEDWSGTLTAYTYPNEFLPYDGIIEVAQGFYFDNQVVRQFGLSFRSRIGNDNDAIAGHKIHLLYHLTASPSEKEYTSTSDNSEAVEFSWDLSGVPEIVPGFRPTVHAIFDTTKMDPLLKTWIENTLYGTDTTAPRLPSLVEVMQQISDFADPSKAPVKRRNSVIEPKPATYGASFWESGGGTNNTVLDGTWCVCTMVANSSGYVFAPASVDSFVSGEKVTAALTYKIDVNPGGTSATHMAVVVHKRNGNTYYNTIRQIRPMVVGQEETVILQFNCPADQVANDFQIVVISCTASGATTAVAPGFILRAKNPYIEKGTTKGIFFKGDDPDTATIDYSWEGAANASASLERSWYDSTRPYSPLVTEPIEEPI